MSWCSWGFYCGTKEYLVLGYDKGTIGWFLLLGLMFGTFMLYEVFEKLMLGNLCLRSWLGLEVFVWFSVGFWLL